jgi:hypothetical protein
MPAASLGHYASLSLVVRGRGRRSEVRDQRTERNQRSEIRRRRSGVKLISDAGTRRYGDAARRGKTTEGIGKI